MTIKMKTCALCQKPMSEKYRPFCSKRCADVDLNRWLNGSYAIPAQEEEPMSEEVKLMASPSVLPK